MKLKGLVILVILILLILGGVLIIKSKLEKNSYKDPIYPHYEDNVNKKPATTVIVYTKKISTINLPIIMYHYVEYVKDPKDTIRKSLDINPYVFEKQLKSIKDNGLTSYFVRDIPDIFSGKIKDGGDHKIILTFDDGYEDFYSDAYPILSSLGFHATMFTISGLVNNPDYLTWDQISSMNGLTLFANHTWSHASLPSATNAKMQSEISLADSQLTSRGLDNPKVFAYPNGGYTAAAATYLQSLGYQVAFGTAPGSTLCKKQRFDLPRVRIGNTSLSYYGF